MLAVWASRHGLLLSVCAKPTRYLSFFASVGTPPPPLLAPGAFVLVAPVEQAPTRNAVARTTPSARVVRFIGSSTSTSAPSGPARRAAARPVFWHAPVRTETTSASSWSSGRMAGFGRLGYPVRPRHRDPRLEVGR